MPLEETVIPLMREVIYDTYANFPSAGLTKGDLAWATDRKCLYRWSGSAWQPIGISSRHGDYEDRGDPADYPESSLYQADDTNTLYMIVIGAWQQITTDPGLPTFAAGDVVVAAADTQQSTQETTYEKLKEIQIGSGGIVRVSFGLWAGSGTAYGRVYKNGVAHGIERSTSATSEQTYTEDLEFVAGDLVQIYGRHPSGYSCKIAHFKLKADKQHMHRVILDSS